MICFRLEGEPDIFFNNYSTLLTMVLEACLFEL